MNTRNTFLAILTAALAVPALADTSAPGVTREQVKAEYIRALKAGELDYGREFTSPLVDVRKSGGTTSAASGKIEELPPTASGNARQASVPMAGKTVN